MTTPWEKMPWHILREGPHTMAEPLPVPRVESPMDIIIVRVVNTCVAAPAQWDAWTNEGQYLYLRYRHGIGRVEEHDTPDCELWDLNTVVTPIRKFTWCDCGEFYGGCIHSGNAEKHCYSGYITLEHFCVLAGIVLRSRDIPPGMISNV